MRKARLTLETGGIYHLTSRIIEKKLLLDDTEKERMRETMWQVAGFCGVEILTHCIMGNHFHILLEVPPAPKDLDAEAIARHLECLPKAPSARLSPAETFRSRLVHYGKRGLSPNEYVDSTRERMFDLSRFVQEFKQRFTQDYNRRHSRKGTLWEDRFHSVLLEPNARVLWKVAAYIDLNPLRAGLCTDPKDYRFGGYAGAAAGEARCLAGLRRLCELIDAAWSWKLDKALAAYRMVLFGDAAPQPARGKRKARAGLSDQAIRGVREVAGALGLSEKLMHKLRYLNESAILGGRIFVENQALRYRERNRLRRMPVAKAIPSETATAGEGLLMI
jgi:putative transposase